MLICLTLSINLDVVGITNSYTPGDEKVRILALSLQGIVNRDSARLYFLWEPPWLPLWSKDWLEYYELKGWVTYDTIFLDSTLQKYIGEVNGFVVYDTVFRHSINIATTMAGLYDVLIAHPSYIPKLRDTLGLSIFRDLRGMWTDRVAAYDWQYDSLFPYCNKDIIQTMDVDAPHSQRDYPITMEAAVVDLRVRDWIYPPEERELLEAYFQSMNPFATVTGCWDCDTIYGCEEGEYQSLLSKHGLVSFNNALHILPNLSVHSRMPADTTYTQFHADTFELDTTKIYCTYNPADGIIDLMYWRQRGWHGSILCVELYQ